VWQAGTIVTKGDAKVQVAGSGKKLRGLRHGPHRPDLCILDDIENDEQVRNPDQRDKLQSWLTKTVLPLGGAGAKFDCIYIGTILHYDSVLNRTLANPMWRAAKFKALLKWPDRMDLWERWEELLRNTGEAEADRYYANSRAEMDAGSECAWADPQGAAPAAPPPAPCNVRRIANMAKSPLKAAGAAAVFTAEELAADPLGSPAAGEHAFSHLHVRALADGFRRAGRAWPAEGVKVAAEAFSVEQIAQLMSEPQLIVTLLSSPAAE
jgi:hypothetical protein